MTTFEQLAKYHPQLESFEIPTQFWEELYQLFKQRMEEEYRCKHTEEKRVFMWKCKACGEDFYFEADKNAHACTKT